MPPAVRAHGMSMLIDAAAVGAPLNVQENVLTNSRDTGVMFVVPGAMTKSLVCPAAIGAAHCATTCSSVFPRTSNGIVWYDVPFSDETGNRTDADAACWSRITVLPTASTVRAITLQTAGGAAVPLSSSPNA